MSDKRIHAYHNLSVMLLAGMPVLRALTTVRARGAYGRAFSRLAALIQAEGLDISAGMERSPRLFDPLDVMLIRAGEQSGQLGEMFAELSSWYAFRDRLNRTIRSGLILPALYVEALAFIGPVTGIVLTEWSLSKYLTQALIIHLCFYVPALMVIGIIKFTPKRGPIRLIFDTFVAYLPLIGGAVRQLSLSRYAKVFSMLYSAGVPIIDCSELATRACGNQYMVNLLIKGHEFARQGEPMAAGFAKKLGEDFVGLWEVGEESGDLDEMSERIGRICADNAERKFQAIAAWVPRIIYFIVCCFMIYAIFKGYAAIGSKMDGLF